MKSMNEARQFLNSLNIGTDYIIVGCSGGPDSMCLLTLLKEEKYKIICAHVDHNIRKESKEEYECLEMFCKTNKIIFEGLKLNEKGKNESYYRKIRYNFYKNLANKYRTRWIATAHHGDDLIETILMRITRGSNLKGYAGFSKIYNEKGYTYIKPLIFYTKDQIIEYNNENSIQYFEDKTNEEDKYTRNRYRHHVLPFLKSENINVHRKYLRYSEQLNKAKDYIFRTVSIAIKDNYNGKSIDLEKFNNLDDYIKEVELETVLSQIYGDDIDKIHTKHITMILKSIGTGKNFSLNLPNQKVLKREYNALYVMDEVANTEYDFEIDEKVNLPNGYLIRKVAFSEDTSNYTTRICGKDITFPLRVRTRKKGDTIEVKNLNGTKKVKKIFIDEKIPTSIRDTWPIVVDSKENVIWIPGLKKSKFDNDKTQNYDIILKYERKGKIDEK